MACKQQRPQIETDEMLHLGFVIDIYIYVYVCMYVCIYIYINLFIKSTPPQKKKLTKLLTDVNWIHQQQHHHPKTTRLVNTVRIVDAEKQKKRKNAKISQSNSWIH